jgi:hypothetical protein
MNLEVVNLESLGLVELNAQEVQEIEGGILPALILIGMLLWSTSAY